MKWRPTVGALFNGEKEEKMDPNTRNILLGIAVIAVVYLIYVAATSRMRHNMAKNWMRENPEFVSYELYTRWGWLKKRGIFINSAGEREKVDRSTTRFDVIRERGMKDLPNIYIAVFYDGRDSFDKEKKTKVVFFQ